MNKITLLLILLFTITTPTYGEINNFNSTKKKLPSIYSGEELTFYCNCKYIKDTINWNSCGYKPKSKTPSSIKRAKRLEWEHVVPAFTFGSKFSEWENGHELCKTSSGKTYKGRRCVKKVNKLFNIMEGDPNNIVPAVGQINATRKNWPYGIIKGEKRNYGLCDFEYYNKIAEPRNSIRGDIARIYLYMHWKYPSIKIISNVNELNMFFQWNSDDPVSNWEIERNKRIYNIFGVYNPFIQKLKK